MPEPRISRIRVKEQRTFEISAEVDGREFRQRIMAYSEKEAVEAFKVIVRSWAAGGYGPYW